MKTSLDNSSLGEARSDTRWDRWVANGREHEADTQYRGRLVALLIGSIIVVGVVVTLAIG